MGKKKKVISGYMYFLDVQFTLGHEIDELVAITAADRVIWEGSVTQSQTLSVYQDQIFGGFDREGGMAGQIDVMFGGVNQSVNPFLKTSMEMAGIGGPVPAYRGSCNLFFRGTLNNHPDVPEWTTVAEERPVEDYLPFAIGDVAQRTLAFSQSEGFYWTANSPYFKPPSFKVRRSKSTWYPEKATIVNNGGASKNLNPAHIIYETITNGNWGMGYPLGAVDDAKMRIAADKLYQEGFGMGLRWNNQMSIEDFLKYVLQHIAGVMNTDRSTGKYYVKLIRDDQNINTLPLLNPDNCILDDYNTVVPGETVNQITIKFVNHLTGKPNAVTIDDLKGVFDQGQVIAQQLDMMGVNDPDLAARIAQREMNVRSRPLSKIALTCTREAYSLYEGDAFAFSWPELGIQMVQYRVLEIDLGTLEDNKIVIQAVEDVFGMPQSSYARPQAPGWVDNNQQPLAVVKQAVREISYYELFTQTTESDRQGLDLNFSFNRIFAEKPQGDTIRYKALYSPSGVAETFTEIAAGDWTPTAVISTPVGELTETLQIGAGRGLSVVADGSLAYIGDEIVLVESFGTGTINVKRGCVDTQPKDHPAGETIWFHDTKFFAEDDEERLPGEQTVYKLLTVTSNGTLPQSLATPIIKIVQGRMIKPYPPANVKISGNYFPDRAIGGLNLEWSSRNRVLQTVPGDPVHWKMGDVTPEPGTNYRVKLFAGNTPVLETFTAEKNFNLTNLTTEIPNPVTIEIASVNGTNVCAQPFRHTVTRVGYGLRYGESWGGLNTPGVVLPPQEATIDVAVSIAKQSMSQFLPIGAANVISDINDPYYSNVTLHLSFIGRTDIQDIFDSSSFNQQPVAVTSDLIVSDADSVAYPDTGGSCGRFEDDDIEYAYNPINSLGNSDFTIEFFIKETTSWSGYGGIFNQRFVFSDHDISIYRDYTLPGTIGLSINNGAFGLSIPGLNFGVWNHVAITRQGNTFRGFTNGQLQITGTFTGSINDTGKNTRIGRMNYGSFPLVGRLQHLRVTKGVCRYAVNFTPSLDTFTDTSKRYDILKTNFEGLLVDYSPAEKSLQLTSGATISTERAKFGAYSLKCLPSTIEGLVATPGNTLASSFTIQFFVYREAGQGGELFSFGSPSTPGSIRYGISPGDGLLYHNTGSTFPISSIPVPAGQWSHVVILRRSGTLKTYINGIHGAEDIIQGFSGTPEAIYIGRGSSLFIDDLRVTNHLALYTGNFTPPNSSVVTISNTGEKRILFKYLGFDRGNQQYRPGVAWMLPDDDTIRYNMLSSIPYGENITISDNFLVAQGGTHFSRTAAVTAHLATSANYQTMERQGWPNANIGNTGTLTNLATDGQRVVTGTTHTNSPHPTNLARVIAYSDNGLEFQDAGNFTGLGTGFKNCKFINGRFWFGCELVNGRVQFASTPQNNQGQLSVYSPINLPVSTLTTYWGFVRPRDFFTNRVIFEVNSSSASGAFVDGTGSRVDFAAYDGTNFSLYQIVGSGSTDVWTGFTTFQNKLYAFSKGKIAYTTDLNSWTIVNLSNPGWLYQNAMAVGSICIVQRFDSSLPFAAGNDAAFKLFKTSDFVTFTELDIQPWVP